MSELLSGTVDIKPVSGIEADADSWESQVMSYIALLHQGWLCQLGDGVMARVDGDVLGFVTTGYPYPDMGAPQEELLYGFLQPSGAFGSLGELQGWYAEVVRWLGMLRGRSGGLGYKLTPGFYLGYGLADYCGEGYAAFAVSGGGCMFLPKGCPLGVFPYLGRLVALDGGVDALKGMAWWLGAAHAPVFAPLGSLGKWKANLFVDRVKKALPPEIGASLGLQPVMAVLWRLALQAGEWLQGVTGEWFDNVFLPGLVGDFYVLGLDLVMGEALPRLASAKGWEYFPGTGLFGYKDAAVGRCMGNPKRGGYVVPTDPFWGKPMWRLFDHAEGDMVYLDLSRVWGRDLAAFWGLGRGFGNPNQGKVVRVDLNPILAMVVARFVGGAGTAKMVMFGGLPQMGSVFSGYAPVGNIKGVFHLLQASGVSLVRDGMYRLELRYGDSLSGLLLQLGLDNLNCEFMSDIRAAVVCAFSKHWCLQRLFDMAGFEARLAVVEDNSDVVEIEVQLIEYKD